MKIYRILLILVATIISLATIGQSWDVHQAIKQGRAKLESEVKFDLSEDQWNDNGKTNAQNDCMIEINGCEPYSIQYSQKNVTILDRSHCDEGTTYSMKIATIPEVAIILEVGNCGLLRVEDNYDDFKIVSTSIIDGLQFTLFKIFDHTHDITVYVLEIIPNYNARLLAQIVFPLSLSISEISTRISDNFQIMNEDGNPIIFPF